VHYGANVPSDFPKLPEIDYAGVSGEARRVWKEQCCRARGAGKNEKQCGRYDQDAQRSGAGDGEQARSDSIARGVFDPRGSAQATAYFCARERGDRE
jgi:hypothetical protein